LLNLLRRVLGGAARPPAAAVTPQAVADPVVRAGGQSLDLLEGADWHEGLPHPDWARAAEWLQGLPESDRADAWLQCEREWLLQLRDALGGAYRLLESDRAFLLAAHEPVTAEATLQFLGRTERRVQAMLEELAAPADMGKEILLLFEDIDDYYRYISYFYPEDGEFAMSAGMFINAGCGHFVVHGEDLALFEPTIAHEMTHSQLAHLPIPAWLNEGMAVNAEQRLTRLGADAWSVQHLEARHRKFWTPETIQWFWSGAAYVRPDEGSELAYDLGRLIVNGLSSDWAGFKRFALQANLADAGAAAARDQLGLDLGEFVRHFLGQDDGRWGPDPVAWEQPPERGQF
jgi:hypothetical protein